MVARLAERPADVALWRSTIRPLGLGEEQMQVLDAVLTAVESVQAGTPAEEATQGVVDVFDRLALDGKTDLGTYMKGFWPE